MIIKQLKGYQQKNSLVYTLIIPVTGKSMLNILTVNLVQHDH